MDSVSIVPSSANGSLTSGKMSAILDTGTSLIAGPTLAINFINRQIGAQNYVSGWYTLNCSTLSSLPLVIFTIGGHNFTLGPRDYVLQTGPATCLSGFTAVDLSQNLWILGDLFIAKYYSVFDHANKRVGLAEAVKSKGSG